MAQRVRRAARRVATVARASVARARRVGSAARRVAVSVVRSPRVRRAAGAVVRSAGALGMAQARILPAALGGYAVGMLERQQRKAHAKSVSGEGESKGSGALIKDPTTRLAVGLALTAFAASRLQGVAREVACGAAGGIGAIYEMYKCTDGSNPSDSFLDDVKADKAGI